MKGFFDKNRLQIPFKSHGRIHSCVSCGLYKTASHPKIEPYGKGKKGIAIIGEAPEAVDDREGLFWQGRSGKVLQRKLSGLGIDLYEDCVSVHAVNCIPLDKNGNVRMPTEHEIACCRPRIINSLRPFRPQMVLLLGDAPISSLIAYKWKKELGTIHRWRGWTIPDREYQTWLCPTYSPTFVLSQQENNEVEVIWDKDIRQALEKAKEPFPQWKDEESCVKICRNMTEIREHLKDATLFAFDLETTGIKPYDTSIHKIVCISFCANEEQSYVIPFPTDRKDLRMLKKLLENPKIGKIAANIKFEDTWMNILCGIKVKPWKFDTMLATHVLDNRPRINGLKFQAYVQYGVLGYEDFIESYLKGKDSYGVNNIMELVKDKSMFHKLMIYCGIDSLLEFRLAKDQMARLGVEIKNA